MIKQRSLLIYILLSIVTCGIYSIIFMHTLAEEVNIMCKDDGKFTQSYIVAFILGVITCGIYTFIWYYGIAERLQQNGNRYGVDIKEGGIHVLLWMTAGSLLLGLGVFVAFHIMIKNFNAIAAAYNSNNVNNNSYMMR